MRNNITITQGKYQLSHIRYVDDFGRETDSFNLMDTESRLNMPFRAPIKVLDLTKDPLINILGYEYTNEDYDKMLDEHIPKLKLAIESRAK